ncbi:MAG: hypothetical protein DCF25_06750 [Leptolyngbya foveolarum]|uniref:Transposase IS4-like domain-containing protein n=1 Tax=Leptolyngbya foveolarum TaxID=47253 RepID=A0A2W4UJJ8_9CYAN|nr:MAG: hypothetical protein DCF25_06750 [Leptolyngbya foveolarum]
MPIYQGVSKAQALIEQLGGGLPALVSGYRVKILDGNHLAATERRLAVLRTVGSAPLPGHALVILDPALMLAIDVFACEDGHTQERALFGRVLATVLSRDLWIADRNFCTLGFLFGLHARGGFFVIRQHGNLPSQALNQLSSIGTNETGTVLEQSIQLTFNHTLSLPLRRVTVRLKHPTRDGEIEIAMLSNLPAADALAVKIAALYQKR